MIEFFDIMVVIASVVALAAVWYSRRLGRQVKDLKRKEYYVEQKLNGITKQISEAVDPLRIQLAAIAAGLSVSDQLIRTGRLYENVSAEEAERIIGQIQKNNVDHVMIVDVRTPREFASRHIPGAKLIPVEELERRYHTEIPMTTEKVFVYCAMGDRSRLACDYLSRQGYMNLYNVVDGLQKWKGATSAETTESLIHIQSKSSA
jgi:rhodanese-related sulfurtransferase